MSGTLNVTKRLFLDLIINHVEDSTIHELTHAYGDADEFSNAIRNSTIAINAIRPLLNQV